jgi:hypothetical protein
MDGQIVGNGEVERRDGFAPFLVLIVNEPPAAQLHVKMAEGKSDLRLLAGGHFQNFRHETSMRSISTMPVMGE